MRFTVVPLLVALVAAFPSVRQDLTLQLDPYQEACFYDEVRAGQKVFVHYAVSVGGFLVTDIVITSPSGFEVYSEYASPDGKILFMADETGEYSVCFMNRVSSADHKSIMFTIVVGDPLEEIHKRDLPGPLHATKNISYIDPLDATLLRISEILSEVRNEQDYLRTRERVHREAVETTLSRVEWKFYISCVVYFGLLALDAAYLRGLVEKKLRV